MATDAKTLLSQANCYACYTTMEWDLLVLALLAQWVNNAAVLPIDPVVTAWVARAQANGGNPSQKSITAVNVLWHSIKVAGIDGKMIHLNPVAPDDYPTATTPLIVGPGGHNQWVDVFGGLRLSQTNLLQGLNGDFTYTSRQAFGTGVIPSTTIAVAGNVGYSVYVSVAEPDGNAHTHCGCDDYLSARPVQTKLIYDFLFVSTENSDNFGWSGSTDYKPWSGFVSANATAAEGWKNYASNTSVGVAFQSIPVNQGGQTPFNIQALAQTTDIYVLDSNGQFSEPSGETISFMAFHQGLTGVQATALYNAVQTYRVALGGGYV